METADLDRIEVRLMSMACLPSELDAVTEEILEGDLSPDSISNVLIGISALFEIQFRQFADEYKKLQKEVLSYRSEATQQN